MISPNEQVVSPRIAPVWRDFSDFEHLSRDLAIYFANTAGFIAHPSEADRILPKRVDDTNYGPQAVEFARSCSKEGAGLCPWDCRTAKRQEPAPATQ